MIQIQTGTDQKLVGDLKAKGIEMNTVDLAPFNAATQSVTEAWLKGSQGAFVNKVVDAAQAVRAGK